MTLKRRVCLPGEGRWVNAWARASFLVGLGFLCGWGFKVTRQVSALYLGIVVLVAALLVVLAHFSNFTG